MQPGLRSPLLRRGALEKKPHDMPVPASYPLCGPVAFSSPKLARQGPQGFVPAVMAAVVADVFQRDGCCLQHGRQETGSGGLDWGLSGNEAGFRQATVMGAWWP